MKMVSDRVKEALRMELAFPPCKHVPLGQHQPCPENCNKSPTYGDHLEGVMDELRMERLMNGEYP